MEKINKRERQERILARLASTVAVRIATLAEEFDVTTETVRRDLDELASRGLLARTYGGAAGRALASEPGVKTRAQKLVAERHRIARRAAGLISSGDVVMIDAGSTTTHFAEALMQNAIEIKVITNSLGAARLLGQADAIEVMFCPGELRWTEEGVFGQETLAFLDRFHADFAFIGAGGFTATEVTDADDKATWIKRKMIERAGRAVLIADHEKIGRTQFAHVCAIGDLDDIVTDAKLPEQYAEAMARASVEIHIAAAGLASLAAA
jgi:DeoR/GlpR family transcriptional regulator of sugar metabolism